MFFLLCHAHLYIHPVVPAHSSTATSGGSIDSCRPSSKAGPSGGARSSTTGSSQNEESTVNKRPHPLEFKPRPLKASLCIDLHFVFYSHVEIHAALSHYSVQKECVK